jgi:hypothetical protein
MWNFKKRLIRGIRCWVFKSAMGVSPWVFIIIVLFSFYVVIFSSWIFSIILKPEIMC